MFRDDLDRVVDEIENSEVMWLGISHRMHGYDIDDLDEVSVRSEVARLTRLYDKAVRSNTMNNPDMYVQGSISGQDASTGLRARPNLQGVPIAQAPGAPPVTNQAQTSASAPPVPDPDESPATAAKPTAASPIPPSAGDTLAQAQNGKQTEDTTSQVKNVPATEQTDTANNLPLAADVDEGPVTANRGSQHSSSLNTKSEAKKETNPGKE